MVKIRGEGCGDIKIVVNLVYDKGPVSLVTFFIKSFVKTWSGVEAFREDDNPWSGVEVTSYVTHNALSRTSSVLTQEKRHDKTMMNTQSNERLN